MTNEEETEFSRTFPRTIDGMRVAVAGLPADMYVVTDDKVLFRAASVRELKAMDRLPHPVEVIIPYRLRHDSKVRVRRRDEGER
jgi:hypothetical protein